MEGDAVEGPVDCVCRGKMEINLGKTKSGEHWWHYKEWLF